MISSLSGDNYYLIKAEVKSLSDSLELSKDDLGLTFINANETNLEDIKLELSAYSLFSPIRLIVINEASKLKGFDEYLPKLSEDLPDSTHVILIESTLDKRKSYYKYLIKNTDFKVFNKLNKPTLTKWAIDFVTSLGGQLSFTDADYLVGRVGDDQLLLSHELEKLVLYSNEISRDSIDLLTERSPDSTIFELLDASFRSNLKQALNIYNEQRSLKVEPEQILAMLSWQLTTLALYMTSQNLPSSEVLSISGLSPYTLTRAKQIASKLSFSKLKELVSDLSSLDLKSKTVALDLDQGLKNFIVGLCI